MYHRGINRHARKRKHKRKMKQRYGYGSLFSGYRSNIRLMEDEYRREYGDDADHRNGGYKYWQAYYLSGMRRFAKEATNGVIRAMYRAMLRSADPEALDDIQALRGSDYEKTFDYDWTIW